MFTLLIALAWMCALLQYTTILEGQAPVPRKNIWGNRPTLPGNGLTAPYWEV